MAWTTITETDLRSMLTTAEVQSIRAHVQQPGGADPVVVAIGHAIREVRGYIMVKRRLEAGLTVPDELRRTTLVVARHHLLSMLPTGTLMTEGRRKDYDDAVAQLRSVARGEFGIEEPAAPIQPAAAPATSTVVFSSSGLKRSDVRF